MNILKEYFKNRTNSYLCNIFVYENKHFKMEEIKTLFKEEELNDLNNDIEIFITVSEYLNDWIDFLTLNFNKIFKNIFVKLCIITKSILDCMRGITELHQLSIIHCDISFSNVSIRYINNLNDNDDDEMVLFNILKGNFITTFQTIIFDYNHSKMENQLIYPNFSDDIIEETTNELFYYPLVTQGYYPSQFENIIFTKAHDIYSIGILLGQILEILIPIDNIYYKNIQELKNKIISVMYSQACDTLVDKVLLQVKLLNDNREKICCGNVLLSKIMEKICSLIITMINKSNEITNKLLNGGGEYYCKDKINEIILLLKQQQQGDDH